MRERKALLNGTLLQYSCLVNPMGGGACQATVHGVARSQTRLSDFTSTFPLVQYHLFDAGYIIIFKHCITSYAAHECWLPVTLRNCVSFFALLEKWTNVTLTPPTQEN